jgi:hypothetical protein
MTPPPARRVRKKRRRRSLVERFWWIGLVAAAAGAIAVLSMVSRTGRSSGAVFAGYIEDPVLLEQQYARFHGKPLKDENLRQQFQQAAQLARVRDLRGAVSLLEGIAGQAGVPLVFNDLGVLYEQLNDRARAITAFREALARDAGYQPVRQNLSRLKNLAPGSADPVTHEVEPNSNALLANLIPLGAPVEGAISGADDEDYFRFTAPPAPRDVLEIRIENRSRTLAPGLAVLDADKRFIGWGKDTREPGASVVQYLSPDPNATLYLQIWGHKNTEGEYVLTVRPLKAFDAYEPNDDIYSTPKLPIGQAIDASIMDERDTDYFSFVAPREGQVEIQIENRSATLIPALTTYAPDRRFAGFGPDVRTAGAGMKHSLAVHEGKTYYLQVWPQANSRGAYRLTVR